MDSSNPLQESCQRQDDLGAKENSRNNDVHMNPVADETMHLASDSNNAEQLESAPENATSVGTVPQSDVTPQPAANNSGRSRRKGKSSNTNSVSRKYTLRSSVEGSRVLKPSSNEALNTPVTNTATTPGNPTADRRKNRKRRVIKNKAAADEISRIKSRIKYLSARMNYEQSLIEAYTGDGWKRQSVERVRPEKEIQRARSEILRRKLEIRDLFKRLDMLCSEGKLQKTFFDSEGRIDNEYIFCAKCGSKDYASNNDIVLCDGGCDRGFHQMCLIPPLLNIPPGDEGWLCPGCDCRADCFNLLNEVQGTNLSIEDKWEKVFPEAASFAVGDKQYDDLGLPSEDSEDDDFNPDQPEPDERSMTERSSSEGSSSEESSSESDFSSASDDMCTTAGDKQRTNDGFPSDDSEDKDYNPDAPESNDNVQNEDSSDNESDFSSDTNDLVNSKYDNESLGSDGESAHAEPTPNSAIPADCFNGEELKSSQKMKHMLSSEQDIGGECASLCSGKRHCERLDYKKLNDETYRNNPTNLSDDEDWTDTKSSKKEKKSCDETITIMSHNASFWRSPREKAREWNLQELNKKKNKLDARIHYNMESEAKTLTVKPCSMFEKATTSGPERYGREVSQRLCELFKVHAYPTQELLDNLSTEMGITANQVSTWFEDTCRSFSLIETAVAKQAESTSSKDKNKHEPRVEAVSATEAATVQGPLLDANFPTAIKETITVENCTSNRDSTVQTIDEELESRAKLITDTKEGSRTPNSGIIFTGCNVKRRLDTKVVSETNEASGTKSSSLYKDYFNANGSTPYKEPEVTDDSLLNSEYEDVLLDKEETAEAVKSINPSIEHVTPDRKRGKQAIASTPRWNSAKFESKKRRQLKLDDGATNDACTLK